MRLGMRHINYDKVIVEWLDISSDGCDDAWNTEEQLRIYFLLPAQP